jgi:hypothetical protein
MEYSNEWVLGLHRISITIFTSIIRTSRTTGIVSLFFCTLTLDEGSPWGTMVLKRLGMLRDTDYENERQSQQSLRWKYWPRPFRRSCHAIIVVEKLFAEVRVLVRVI